MGIESLANGGVNRISALAQDIQRHADALSSLAAKTDIQPSLAANGSSLSILDTDNDTLQAKSKLLGSIKELSSLVKGPRGILMDIGANEILCLQVICRFQIAQAMRQDEEVPFEELSKRCGLNIKDLQRVLRYAMTDFIFCEPRPGVVSHTSVSQMLAQDHLVRDFVENVCEVRFSASARTADALETWGMSQQPFESGFSLARGTDRGLYDELALHTKEAQRWNSAMSVIAHQANIDWILENFLRVTTYADSPLIVDIGGGRGNVSIGLAERLPNASFVVQDFLQSAIAQGQLESSHLRNRIEFQAYDFRNRQLYANADIYYFRNIFHNWPDMSCIEILRNQIPALKPGASILIDDFTLHEPGTLPWPEERKRRWMDINMLIFFGSRERSPADWRELLKTADLRFQLVGIYSAPNQHNSFLQVLWKG